MKLPFGTVCVTETARKLIDQALTDNRLSSGRLVRSLEEQFAGICGTKHSVAVSSGTDADALALAVLHDFGANRGDEVIVPALSFVSTGGAVLHAGFTPVFVDIDSETLNIDVNRIEQSITDKTVAIMPVHLMGKPANMDAINAIAKEHNLFVVEDAAEAHGGKYKGKNVGSLADMGAFSLYVAHIITSVEGGIITTDREDFAEVIRSLRSHGRACKCKQCVINVSGEICKKRFQNGSDIRFQFERLGFSSKMNELEAAVGLGSMGIYDEILTKRRENLLSMMERIRQFEPFLTTFHEEPHEQIGPHALPILVSEDAPFTRNEFVRFLEDREIDPRDLFSSIPTQCPGFAFLGYEIGDFPQAEYVGRNGLHIGVHHDIGPEEINYLFDTIGEFIDSSKKA